MGKYKNILVPVVLHPSDKAKEAIETAKALLDKGGKLTLLTVVEEIPHYIATGVVVEALVASKNETKEQMQALADECCPGADVLVLDGHASRTILNTAEQRESDCIIIASHRPGLEDYLIGSTAARVVRHAQCSVHILR